MDKIFANADDKYVLNRILYGNASKLYVDAKHTTEVSHDEALDACMKGVLIFATDTYNVVTSFKDASGTLTVNTGETAYTVSGQ